MAIVPPDPPRYDTRGLPEGMDPHMFYEYRRETLVKSATGIESFAYKYIPWTIMKSFAFAIDPLAPFKVAPHRITPYNRSRRRTVASVLQKRYVTTRNYSESAAQTPNFNGISVCWSPSLNRTLSAVSGGTVETTSQPPLTDSSDDTTSRTRLMGSKQGTMRLFKSYINSPGRTVRRVDRAEYIFHPAQGIPSSSCSAVGGSGNHSAWSQTIQRTEISPSAAVFFPNDLTTLRNLEYAYLDELIAKNIFSMVKEWSPNKRSYTLFRNLVELRDIPRSVASLQTAMLNFRSLYSSLARSPKIQKVVFDLGASARDIPSQYLSYHFGWKQTYKDLMELLHLPNAMGKKYKFLIQRAGKPTTFRTKRNFTSALNGGLPAFSYTSSPYENSASSSTRLERVTELRLVINATFDFPPPNLVSFRSHSFMDRIGLVPRPTDLYNLTPWTWLVDYFTGLGSYIECIDNMARDDTLINWGLVTGRTSGRLITQRSSKVDHLLTIREDFVSPVTITTREDLSHQSKLEYECQIRKDVSTVFNVKTTAVPDLTAYQQSIIGALLAQRKGSFTPKS